MIYSILRILLSAAVRVFFRRIEVEGIENVPEEDPVLLLPNHPNALVDALVIVMQLRRPVSLTAKSTLADNAFLRLLIRSTGVILLHRKQDARLGADRSQNVGAIEECLKRLLRGAAICLFPEGQSHSDPSLRPFRWGAARIAIEFTKISGSSRTLKIIPVGLNFLQKEKFRSDVWVRFGKPIDAGLWAMEHHRKEPADLTDEIEKCVRDLTLNFNRRRDSVLMDWVAELLSTGGLPPVPLGQEQKEASSHLILVRLIRDGYENLKEANEAEIKELRSRIIKYRFELKQRGISPAEVYILMTPWRAAWFVIREFTILVLGLPLAAWGVLNHLAPAVIVRAVARKLTSERDQWASNIVFPSIVLFPFFYMVQAALVWIYLSPIYALIYTLSLPISGYAAIRYLERAGGIWQRSRTFIIFLIRPQLQNHLLEEGRQIIRRIQSLGEQVQESAEL